MNKIKFFACLILIFLCISAITPVTVLSSETPTDIKKIAILPFETNASKNISYIKAGIVSMLHSRLTWKDHVQILEQDQIDAAVQKLGTTSKTKAISQIGESTGADYVISGTITEFSGAFSVDTQVYNLKDNSVLTFFDQSKTINEIPSRVDVLAAKINKKVFDRTTVAYEKFKKENVITEEELRRLNPERMMPKHRIQEDEDKPWWKIW